MTDSRLKEIARQHSDRYHFRAGPITEILPVQGYIETALREVAAEAVREEREALTAEIDRLSDQPLTDEQRMDALCRWNLARSRAEEPK